MCRGVIDFPPYIFPDETESDYHCSESSLGPRCVLGMRLTDFY